MQVNMRYKGYKGECEMVKYIAVSCILWSWIAAAVVLKHGLPIDREHVILLESKIDHNSCISFLYDPLTDKTFLIKQKGEGYTKKRRMLEVVRELLGCDMADILQLRGQKVWVLPANLLFVGKFYDNEIATLHEVVPGKRVQDCPEWRHLNIRQRREGNMGLGITRSVVQNMARHPDLPGIVAFDTATGNCSRHRENYFYDEYTKHFYMIDMGGCYKRGQLVGSCRSVESMLNDHALYFSKDEVCALRAYRAVLQSIQKIYPQELMQEKLQHFIVQSGIPLDIVEEIVQSISKILVPSYESLDKLIHLLHMLIDSKTYYQKLEVVSE